MDTDERVAETQRGRLSDKPCFLQLHALVCVAAWDGLWGWGVIISKFKVSQLAGIIKSDF